MGAAKAGLGEVYARTLMVDEANAAFDAAAKADSARCSYLPQESGHYLLPGEECPAQVDAADKAIKADPSLAVLYYIKAHGLAENATVDPKTSKIVLSPGCVAAYRKYLELAPNGQFAQSDRHSATGRRINQTLRQRSQKLARQLVASSASATRATPASVSCAGVIRGNPRTASTLYNPMHESFYLPSPDLLSLDEAAALVAAYAARRARFRPSVERVSLAQALGRVLARPLRADSDQPPFARSTRDGFACRAAEASAHSPLAVAGSTRAGQAPSGPLPRGAAWEIMTGAPVPAGADAVMMLEHVEAGGIPSKRNRPPPAAAHPRKGENIVARGAQARKGDELLPAGTVIGAAQVALAAACGCVELHVFVRPRVAILATGDELVPIQLSPAPGQIRNSNSAHAGRDGDRSRRRAVGSARRTRHGQSPRLRARKGCLGRSAAHHRRRFRWQIRSG